ncbi:N-6 DNA Methylase family protein [Clostridium botulinum]|uniref:type I restriction-modification system subunit M n=1 Tax=Clostridium botulinum TaxID=1491 RepID=UPI0004656AA6|nr:type I restriction-modification system subunit M [Clostridium botulinum]APR00723.1 N-6 DNA Methylase family protein [Clostridium botulinum]NFM30062.1 restriction endonuclease subunit M [Clostridium botulinum]OSA82438.1 restriction endonuclease subunit M [Clostridium botulinum]BDB01911.1 DNA methyltransferase [Clostridium botulinum]
MAKATKAKEVTLESVLWNCRVALRGIGSTEKNRDAVIGLVFLKFAGDKFERRRAELLEQYGDIPVFLEKVSFYNAVNVYYLKETARWSYIVKNTSANDIAIILDQAMADIEESNTPLKGALPLNLFATLGASKEAIKNLIDEVNKIDEKRFHEDDLIGRVYEYFLQVYAAAGTKEDGEFYTPASVVKLIAEMIEPYSGTVYDPCCGSGGMFVQSLKFVDRHNGNRQNVSILGQESNPDTWRLCKMNLAIRGIAHNLGEKNASTFTEDLHKDKKVDYIMANPPFNLKGWRGKDQLTDDPRFKGFSTPPVANANYAWILHMISKLDVNKGVAGFLLANGALNADGVEYEIRKELLERDKIEAIIVLPRNMFYTTDISVTLWIVNMNKKASTTGGQQLRDRTNEVLFMDLRRWDGNIEEIVIDKGKKKKKTVLTDDQIMEIKKVYRNWQSADTSLYKDVPEFCKSVSLHGEDGIRAKNYSLAPSKYIEFIDHDLEIDYEKEMPRIQAEMREVIKAEKKSQTMLEEAFRGIGYGID